MRVTGNWREIEFYCGERGRHRQRGFLLEQQRNKSKPWGLGGRRKEAQYKETEMWFYEILQSPLFSFLGGWSDHAVGSPLGPSCTLDGLSW